MNREEASHILKLVAFECCEAISKIYKQTHVQQFKEAYNMAIEALEAEERKTGEWIEADLDKNFVTCSNCKRLKLDGRMALRPDYADELNFCPNCGAKMKGDKNGTD